MFLVGSQEESEGECARAGEDPRISFLKLNTGSENRPGLKLGLE